jgi:hypothetical protein
MLLTASGIMVCSLMTLFVLFRSRRFGLVGAYVAFLVILAVVWGYAFVSISFDAFD